MSHSSQRFTQLAPVRVLVSVVTAALPHASWLAAKPRRPPELRRTPPRTSWIPRVALTVLRTPPQHPRRLALAWSPYRARAASLSPKAAPPVVESPPPQHCRAVPSPL